MTESSIRPGFPRVPRRHGGAQPSRTQSLCRNGVLKGSAFKGEIRLAPVIIVHNGVDLGSRANHPVRDQLSGYPHITLRPPTLPWILRLHECHHRA